MNRRVRSLLASLCIVFSLVCASVASAAEQQELNFGLISTESSQNLRHIWDPLLADMEKALGMKVNAFFASDYAGVIEAMRFNKIQLAWYGNKAAMEAVDRADGEVFLQTVAANGTDGYYSHLIVHKDSPLNTMQDALAQAANLSFGNGDPNSTSGFLVPAYYVFALNNVDPKAAFKRVLNSSHEVNGLSVANKQIDVATFNSEAMERMRDVQADKAALLKVIWTSPLIPSDPLVWRKDMPADLKEKLVNFFMGYGKTDREKEILKNLQWSGFRKSTNDQLLPIRQMELFKDKGNIQANANLDAAEKQKRIKDIDAQLAVLNARMDEIAKAGK